MKKAIQIDKDISWDNERVELRLYLQEGQITEKIAVRPNKVDIVLNKDGQQMNTFFALPVTVDAQRVTFSRNRSVYGEVIDITAHIHQAVGLSGGAICHAN